MATSNTSVSILRIPFGKYFSSISIRIRFPVLATMSAPIKVSHAKASREMSCAQLMGMPTVLAIAEKNTRTEIRISIAPARTSSILRTAFEIFFIS